MIATNKCKHRSEGGALRVTESFCSISGFIQLIPTRIANSSRLYREQNVGLVHFSMKVAKFALFIVVGPNGRIDEAERISDKIIAAVTPFLPDVCSHIGRGYYGKPFSTFVCTEDVPKFCGC